MGRHIAHAGRQLARTDQIVLTVDLSDEAATLLHGSILRSLDAIHLAAARSIGAELAAVVTYDLRMADAAAALGIAVEPPT